MVCIMSLQVLEKVLDHADENDHEEGKVDRRLTIGVGDRGDRLKTTDDQKVEVGWLGKLLEEVYGHES